MMEELLIALLGFASVSEKNIARSVVLFILTQLVVFYHIYSMNSFLGVFYLLIYAGLLPILTFVGVNLTKGASHYGKFWPGLIGLIAVFSLFFPSLEGRISFVPSDIWKNFGDLALLQFYLMLASIPAIKSKL